MDLRGEMDGGLYYWQKAKAVAIYDKAAELRAWGASARTLYGWRGVACGSSAHEAANGAIRRQQGQGCNIGAAARGSFGMLN